MHVSAVRLNRFAAAAGLSVTIALAAAPTPTAADSIAPPPTEAAILVRSTQLTVEQKIAGLKAISLRDTRKGAAAKPATNAQPIDAIRILHFLDASEGAAFAQTIFRDQAASTDAKLRIGRFLLSHYRVGEFVGHDAFVTDYAAWLTTEIRERGEAAFCKPTEQRAFTAVGEYAFLSHRFEGYKKMNFKPFEDRRLIPILIQCLNAPDNVYGEIVGEMVGDVRVPGAVTGKSTGRNTARQHIPIALVRLEAVQAIEPIRNTLQHHHDWYLRDNAAYAIGALAPMPELPAFVAYMEGLQVVDDAGKPVYDRDRYLHLFALGKGMLSVGRDAGIEYIGIAYSIYAHEKKLSEMVQMLRERVDILKDIKSPRLAGFFQQVFADERLAAVLRLDEARVIPNDYHHTVYDLNKARKRIEETFALMCDIIETNQLQSLRPQLASLAIESDSDAIKIRAQRCIDRLDR